MELPDLLPPSPDGRPALKLDFCDFWPGFDKIDNFFTRTLSQRFRVVLCDQPDLLIYADKGDVHRLHSCRKIFFTGESIRPDWTECDYAITCFHLDDPRHLRLPYYVFHGPPDPLLLQPGQADRLLAEPRRFCTFIARNGNPRRTRTRLDFLRLLSSYKTVDCGGPVGNNIGRLVPKGTAHKIDFLRTARFTLCFENACLPGYTTEKLYDAVWAGCIPLYWGNPRVAEDFNPKRFLNLLDYPSPQAMLEHVRALDNDPAARLAILSQPLLHGNRPNRWQDPRPVLDFFSAAAADPQTPLAGRRPFLSPGRWRFTKRYR